MLEEKITNDYKQAMKDKDALKVSTLSFLRSQLKYVLIENKSNQLSDAGVITVIKKQVKQRQDWIAQFEKGGRMDLVGKEKNELEILRSYLPQEMSNDDLKKLIDAAILESGVKSMKDMGALMKVLLPRIAGRADSKQVSDLVREKLSQVNAS